MLTIITATNASNVESTMLCGTMLCCDASLAADDETTAHTVHVATNDANDLPEESKARRIMIVDDDEDSAETMALLLQRFGYQVSIAFSGQSSLDQVTRSQVDVVLLDLSLPDMHGTAVAQRLRASGFAGKLIAVSGHSDASMKERCSSAGMDHFVVKPCSVDALRKLL